MTESDKEKILIVENSSFTGNAFKVELTKNGYEVVEIFKTGENAVEYCQNNAVNLVLMDIKLEGDMDGTEAARLIWEKQRIPIIFITGYDDEKNYQAALKAFPFEYIRKPVVMRDLSRSVKTVLSKNKAIIIEKQEILKKAEEYKKNLFFNLSHELLTPLIPVFDFIETAKEKLPSDEYTYAEFGAKRLLATLQNIMDVISINVNTFPISNEFFNLKTKIDEELRILKPFIDEQNINVIIQNGNANHILGDKTIIGKILYNIIDNAIKFSMKGGTIIINVYVSGANIKIGIVDTGIGMEHDFIPKATDAFTQEDVGNTRRYEGLGLGLFLCVKYIGLIGGEITITSQKGNGTQVIISLRQNSSGVL